MVSRSVTQSVISSPVSPITRPSGINSLAFANLPGSSGDFISTPDSVANSITGDIEIIVDLILPDWTPATNQLLVGKIDSTTNRSYFFQVLNAGRLNFTTSTDGSTGGQTTTASTVVTGVPDGTRKRLKVTRDMDNGASGNDTKFFLSDDGITWTQLGDTITTAGVISTFNSDSPVEIGSGFLGTSEVTTGSIHRVQIFDGIDGTLAVDFNAEDYISGSTLTSFSTGEVHTLNGNVTITKAT